jgi:Ca-activated chloride channel homolog
MRLSARLFLMAVAVAAGLGVLYSAEVHSPVFQVNVDMVVLTFTVTDQNGKYVTGLKPSDLRVKEDGVEQKIATLAEGTNLRQSSVELPGDSFAGTKVFILFDTSNMMYPEIAYASDSVADFVRRLDQADSIAVYKFSRNLTRAVPLTGDRDQVFAGVRSACAGDLTALYNSLLLTVRDAAKVPGRKAVVVFSNGPDTASILSPGDVGIVAEDEGIPIYILSTREAMKDEVSAHAFNGLTSMTGGRLFWARTRQMQAAAFSSIRDDLERSYSIAYYPSANSNEGFRKIELEISSDTDHKYKVRTRPGYRPRRIQ